MTFVQKNNFVPNTSSLFYIKSVQFNIKERRTAGNEVVPAGNYLFKVGKITLEQRPNVDAFLYSVEKRLFGVLSANRLKSLFSTVM